MPQVFLVTRLHVLTILREHTRFTLRVQSLVMATLQTLLPRTFLQTRLRFGLQVLVTLLVQVETGASLHFLSVFGLHVLTGTLLHWVFHLAVHVGVVSARRRLRG